MRLSVDDGCASDLRIADLAEKYEVETTFYWPVEWRSLAYEHGYTPLMYSDARDIARKFEVGSHTITHRHLTKLPPMEVAFEVVESKTMLERLFSTKVTKFAPPRGYTNDDITTATLKVYDSQRLTRGEGLVHVHPSSGANGEQPWRKYARSTHVTELWCHSWELDKYDLWDELEAFLKEATQL